MKTHETTYVWQHQNGGTDYAFEALYAQELGEGYDYDLAIGQNRTWFLLNPEQQGKLIEDAYVAGYFHNGQWVDVDQQTGSLIQRPDLARYMQSVVPQLRAGQGAT